MSLRRPTIGVLAGWQFYWTATPLSYLNPIFRGLRALTEQRNCNLLFACGMGSSASLTDPRRPAWPFPSDGADFVPVGPWNTDGLIVINPLRNTHRSADIAQLRATGFPVVFIGAGEAGPTVMADSAGGIHQAMQHLARHGHRAIAFIAGSPDDLAGDTGERLQAYLAAVRVLELSNDERLIAYGEHVLPGGQRAMRTILDSGVPFSAVLASNDESALGALRALRAAKREVPGDIALIGFDDRPEAALQTPPITSVRVPLFTVGLRAGELLLDIIHNQTSPEEVRRVPTQLILRESCGCGTELNGPPASATERGTSASSSLQQFSAALAEVAHTEAPWFSTQELQSITEDLVRCFQADLRDPAGLAFPSQIRAALTRLETQGPPADLHMWQTPLSVLRRVWPDLIDGPTNPADQHRASELFDQARQIISASVQRAQRWLELEHRTRQDRLGQLTARLAAALDEDQVFDTLARYLPEMEVRQAAVTLFATPAGVVSDERGTIRLLTVPAAGTQSITHQDFPPPAFCPEEAPFQLAVIPLVSQRGQVGYMAFETEHMELYGAIVQGVAAALNNAELYHDAMEGRRLAEEASRLKSRFLSTVSHELRTPLNLIVGLSELLLRETGSSKLPLEQRQDIERIQANGQHLSWLIRDVLDMASNEAGQLRLDNEVLDLSQALQPAVELGQELARAKGLTWQAALPAAIWVWGDRTRLRQIALNLIHNAVKFTTQGWIRLQVVRHTHTVVISVADTGLGIPLAEQELIFDAFRRSDLVLTRGYGGLGLGLAICKLLVELHGGTLQVQSSGREGEGSVFSVSLPLADPASVDPPLDGAGSQGIVVLAQPTGRGAELQARLQARGLTVTLLWLDSTDRWLTTLIHSGPAIVVLDISLPPALGWKAFRALKNHPVIQAWPIFFFTLTGAQGGILELDYMVKPVGLDRVGQALEHQGLAAEPNSEKKRTILVVEDDPATLELHCRLVQAHLPESRLLTARNGQEALDCAAAHRLDLILLDLMMPGLDGFDVLETIRQQPGTREVPVVVITGQTLTEQDLVRLNRGVATILQKELFSVEETLNHIEGALLRRRKVGPEAQRLVRRVMAHIHAHYAEPLSRQDLARYAGMSDDYLTACFRKELGMTPVAYITRCRINQARVLLRSTSQTVTEIALAVGFADSGYFSRVFRRETGVSPEKYRNNP